MARGGIKPDQDRSLVFRESQYAARNFKIDGTTIRNFTDTALIPKPRFLFFVKFTISKSALAANLSGLRDTLAYSNIKDGIVFQIKQIDKPKFNINTETLHQYNKKRVIQTKIDYNSMTINFHDDVGNKVLKFWANYYEYYYGDGGRTTTQDWSYDITDHDFYNGQKDGWGYKGAFYGGSHNMHFLESIQLYQFYGQKYTYIEFVRPIITIFDHDNSDYEEGREGTGIRMSFDYEGVIYNLEEQAITNTQANDFGFLSDYYDPPSPDNVETPPTSRQTIANAKADIATPNTGRDTSGNIIQGIQAEIASYSTPTASVLYGERSFGSASSPNTSSLFNLVAASGSKPSPDLVRKETGVKNTVNNFGTSITPSTGSILQQSTQPANTGIDSTKVDQAASILSPERSLNTQPVGNGQTSLSTTTASNEFSQSLGTAAAVAKREGIVSSIATYPNSLNDTSTQANSVVNKLPDGKFQVTEIGATVLNATRAPTSAVGVRTISSPWNNPNTVNNNTRLLNAENGEDSIA